MADVGGPGAPGGGTSGGGTPGGGAPSQGPTNPVQSYGSTPAAGAPNRGAELSAKDVASTNAALATLNERLAKSNDLTSKGHESLQKQLDSVKKILEIQTKATKGWEGNNKSLTALLKTTTDLEDTTKRIQKLQQTKLPPNSGPQAQLALAKAITKEYDGHISRLKGMGNSPAIKKMTQSMERLKAVTASVKITGDKAFDDAQIKKLNRALQATHTHTDKVMKSMGRLRPIQGEFKKLGGIIDEAFGGRFSNSPLIRGVTKMLDFQKAMRSGQQAIRQNQTDRRAAHAQESHARHREVLRTHGAAGAAYLRQIGLGPVGGIGTRKTVGGNAPTSQTPGFAPSGGGGRTAVPGLARRISIPKPRARMVNGQLEELPESVAARTSAIAARRSQLTTVSGALKKQAAGANIEAMQDTLAGSGPIERFMLRRMASAKPGGMVQKIGGSLLTRGGGSMLSGMGEAGVSAGEGIAGAGMGAVSAAAVPVALIAAAVGLRDHFAKQNLEYQTALGGAGLNSGGTGTGYHDLRRSLLSSGMGNAALFGGAKTNLSILGGVASTGLAAGRDARGLDIGAALSGGQGMYGAVFRNAQYNGRAVGMAPEESAKLTIKLMQEYGIVSDKTKDFFYHIDDAMQHAGITGSKYIEIVEAINGQFDYMNKSLHTTTTLLTNVGGSGRYMGDKLKDILTKLTSPVEDTTAQRVYAASTMSKSDKAEMAKSFLAENARDVADFNAQHGGALGNVKLNESGSNRGEVEDAIMKSSMSAADKQAAMNALGATVERGVKANTAAATFSSGNNLAIASQMETLGKSPLENAKFQDLLIRNKAKAAGIDVHDLYSADASRRSAALARASSSGVLAQLDQSGVFGKGVRTSDVISAHIEASNTSAQNAQKFAGELEGKNYGSTTGTDRNKADSIIAMQQALIDSGRATGPKGLKRGTEAYNDALLKAFQGESRLGQVNGKNLTTQLSDLNTTFEQIMDPMSDMSKALNAMDSDMKAAQAEEKAKSIALETKTTADIFADSFEYLFERLVVPLSDLVSFFHAGSSKTGLSTNAQGALAAGVEATNPTDPHIKELKARLKAGVASDKDVSELKDYLRGQTTGAGAGAAQYGLNYADAEQVATGGGGFIQSAATRNAIDAAQARLGNTGGDYAPGSGIARQIFQGANGLTGAAQAEAIKAQLDQARNRDGSSMFSESYDSSSGSLETSASSSVGQAVLATLQSAGMLKVKSDDGKGHITYILNHQSVMAAPKTDAAPNAAPGATASAQSAAPADKK